MSQSDPHIQAVYILGTRASVEARQLDEALGATPSKAILSFQDLIRALAQAGPRHRQIDALGAKLLLQQIVAEAPLPDDLATVSQTSGFTLALYDLIGRCKQSGVGPHALSAFAHEQNDALLAEMAKLFEAYQRRLIEGGSPPAPQNDADGLGARAGEEPEGTEPLAEGAKPLAEGAEPLAEGEESEEGSVATQALAEKSSTAPILPGSVANSAANSMGEDTAIPLADPFDGLHFAQLALDDDASTLPEALLAGDEPMMVVLEDRHGLTVSEGRLIMALEKRLSQDAIPLVFSLPDLSDRPDLAADWQNRREICLPPSLGAGENMLFLQRPLPFAPGDLGLLQERLFQAPVDTLFDTLVDDPSSGEGVEATEQHFPGEDDAVDHAADHAIEDRVDDAGQDFRDGDEYAPDGEITTAAGTIQLVEAANTVTEAKMVIRTLRKAILEGVAPEDIAIVAPDWNELFPIYDDLLKNAGLPFSPPGSPRLSESPVSRTALDLMDLVAEGFPREALIGLFGAGDGAQLIAPQLAIGEGWKDPAEIADFLRRAGAQREWSDSGTTAPYAHHLNALKNQIQHQKHIKETRRDHEMARIEALIIGLDAFFHRLKPLASPHRLSQGVALLRRLLAELGLLPLSEGASPLLQRAHGPAQGDDPLSFLEIATLARDQGAAREMLSLFDKLIRMARLLGDPILQPRQLRQIVAEGINQMHLPLRGARGARLSLLDLKRLSGRHFQRIFIVGLVDGQWPSTQPADPLLPEHLRKQFDPGPGMGAFLDTTVHRLNLEARHLLLAILAAQEGVWISHAKADLEGRELLPSPFLDDIARALPHLEKLVFEASHFKDAQSLAIPRDLNRHLSHLIGQGQKSNPAENIRLAEGTQDGLPLWPVIHHALAIEYQRMAYFLGHIEGHGYVGRLDDAHVLKHLGLNLAGTRKFPISITHLEDYAQCGFKYLSRRILRLGESEEPGEDLDLRQAGNLLHRCLELLYPTLRDAGLLPLNGQSLDGALAQVEGVMVKAAEEWQKTQAHAHSGLFELRRQRMALQLKALLRYEAEEGDIAGEAAPIPTHFEETFGAIKGEEDALPPVEIPNLAGDQKLYLQGTIDRIDTLPQGYRVVDYKSGSVKGQEDKLKAEALAETQLQLPLYALAVQQNLPSTGPIDALYYGLKDAKGSKSLKKALTQKAWKTAHGTMDLDGLLALDGETRGAMATHDPPQPNIANRVWAIRDAMVQGIYEVKPTSCKFCDYASACRITDLADGEEEA